ncbi:MAG: hypothetical protein ACYDHY_07230 [Acidiferrobacterales bacterium]
MTIGAQQLQIFSRTVLSVSINMMELDWNILSHPFLSTAAFTTMSSLLEQPGSLCPSFRFFKRNIFRSDPSVFFAVPFGSALSWSGWISACLAGKLLAASKQLR